MKWSNVEKCVKYLAEAVDLTNWLDEDWDLSEGMSDLSDFELEYMGYV